jgi:hypothetical protein
VLNNIRINGKQFLRNRLKNVPPNGFNLFTVSCLRTIWRDTSSSRQKTHIQIGRHLFVCAA